MTNSVTKFEPRSISVESKFEIPDEIEDIKAVIGQANAIAYACHWGTAAMVYAWTENEGRGRPKNGEKSPFLSISDFAALGIRGLTDRKTVSAYRKAWQHAIDNRIAAPVEPGDVILLPDVDFGSVKNPHVSHNSGENEWYTPAAIIDAAKAVMGGIDLDPASHPAANDIVGADKFYTMKDNGLTQDWFGRVWLNPPYAQPLISQFAAAVVSKRSDYKSICVLVNNATDTDWLQSILSISDAVCFLRGRVKFIDKHGEPSGAPLQGQVVVYRGNNAIAFCDVFSGLGWVASGRRG